MPKAEPMILVVDDKPDGQRAILDHLFASSAIPIKILVVHPDEVTDQNIIDADLVLIDYRLEDWASRDKAESISLRPINGLALAAILRAHATTLEEGNYSPTAFVIFSDHLQDLSGDLPPESREHAIARSHNLEWVVPKNKINPSQLISLVKSVEQLPVSWFADKPEETKKLLKNLFAFPEESSWTFRAWEDIEACHPPIHELSNWSHGLALLRWLLHRILPYPCFLINTRHFATRLRVTHNSLLDAMTNNDRFISWLEPAKYRGILNEFLGDRWWRSGIDSLLWSLTDGNPFDPEKIRGKIFSETGYALEPIEISQAVICLNKDFQEIDEAYSIENAIRIQPDDWPPYADQAWTSIELAKEEPSLRALVIGQDKEILNQ